MVMDRCEAHEAKLMPIDEPLSEDLNQSRIVNGK
jgi:hypothetical protein